MNHFYNEIDSEDWFNFPNLYKYFINVCPAYGTIVEVGSWKGKSLAYLIVEAINSKHKNKCIKIYCVDTWLGDKTTKENKDIINGTLYEKFMKNMTPVIGSFEPLKMTSIEASKKFIDNSLDIVFIDASHEYEDIKSDIIAWLPKVKNTGILAGHDLIPFNGVEKAVKELLPYYECAEKSCWVFNKNKTKEK